MTLNECAALLREHDNYILITHVRPDGDTLGSASALCSALRRLGKRAALLSNPQTTQTYLDLCEKYFSPEIPDGAYVISVDTADKTMFQKGFSGGVDLSLDHHPSNTGYARTTVVDHTLAACGELVLDLIEELCGGLTAEEASLLYAAVSTDSGCFCYGNTTARTLRDAARLVDYGADNARLNKLLFRSFSFGRLKLEGMVFSTLRSYRGNAINVAVITREMLEAAGVTEDDCDDLASLAGRVRGNVVAITVREIEDGWSKASVRTNELVNSSDICAHLGGGGHAMAAGCTVRMGPYELADRLVEITNEIWK